MRVRKFVAIAGENLDPVIRPGIVRRRDYNARVKSLRTRKVGNTRSRDHTRAAHLDSHRLQSLPDPVCNPTAGLACVLSNDDPRLRIAANQIMSQGAPD